jgi:hypothetical protein
LNASNMALRDKLVGETDTKEMLDDNMRVLGRRVNDLEIDLNDKKDRIKVLRN